MKVVKLEPTGEVEYCITQYCNQEQEMPDARIFEVRRGVRTQSYYPQETYDALMSRGHTPESFMYLQPVTVASPNDQLVFTQMAGLMRQVSWGDGFDD
jgi:hypothetical protein